jgi:hypothetical protein
MKNFDCEGVDDKDSKPMSDAMTYLFDRWRNRIQKSSKTRSYLIVTALRKTSSLLQIEIWLHLTLQ